MKKYLLTSLILFATIANAQVSNETKDAKLPEKYNGYGLPNTQFKKINVIDKKKKTNTEQDEIINAIATPANPRRSTENSVFDKAKGVKSNDEIKLSMSAELSYSTQLDKKLDNGAKPEGAGIELDPVLKIYNYSLKGKFSYAYDLIQPETENDWDDGRITLARDAWDFGSYIKSSPYIAIDLPLSKESRENRTMKYIGNLGLTTSLNSKNAGVENLILSYDLSYGSFSNDFTTRADGVTPTYKYRFIQALTTGYNIGSFSLLAIFSFSSNYSYENVVRNGFKHVEIINYSFNDNLYMYIGHLNKGPFLKANSYENNVQFYDKDSSTVFTAIGTSF